MKLCLIKTTSIFLLLLLLVIFGCNNSDSVKTGKNQTSLSPLVGTWQRTAVGEKKVSDVLVKIIFSEHTLTMDAPGCLISGNYSTRDDVLTFTITSTQGDRCASDQTIGRTESVHYRVIDSELTLIPLMAGKESHLVYRRVDGSRPE